MKMPATMIEATTEAASIQNFMTDYSPTYRTRYPEKRSTQTTWARKISTTRGSKRNRPIAGWLVMIHGSPWFGCTKKARQLIHCNPKIEKKTRLKLEFPNFMNGRVLFSPM